MWIAGTVLLVVTFIALMARVEKSITRPPEGECMECGQAPATVVMDGVNFCEPCARDVEAHEEWP